MAGAALASDITFGYKHPVTGERTGPFPKQAIAHRCPADIIFFGGAAGPGKSEMDTVEAITTVLEFPDVEVALFRRKNTELEKSLIGRFRRLAPLDARGQPVFRYNGTLHYADCTLTRSRIWFCHAIHEDTVYDYQSAEWVLLIIDEASHFTQFQVDYLQTRVRSARPGMRKRTILTSNPGGVGHGWLKRRFVKPPPSAVQEIILRYNHDTGVWEPPAERHGHGLIVQPLDVWRPWPEPEDPTPPEDMDTRCFVPARMEDNPALALADPRYKAKIYALGGAKAKQLAEGDWDANDSMIVGAVWQESHVVSATDVDLQRAHGCTVGQVISWHIHPDPTWRPPATAAVYGSVDYGYGAPWSFHLHAVLPGGHTRTFFEFYKAKVRDVEQAAMIADAIRSLMAGGMQKPEWIVGDPAMWNSRQETGNSKSVAEVYIDALQPLGVTFRKGAAGRGARVSRPQRWLDALSVSPDGLPWWSVTTGCPHMIRTVPEVPWDEDDPEVEDDDSENHCIAAGTLVQCSDGDRPIEHVRAGMLVETREGLREVIRAWRASPSREVLEVTFANGRSVRATPDHDIWVEGRGWVRCDALREGDTCCVRNDLSWSRPPFKSGAACASIDAAPISARSGTADYIVGYGPTCAALSPLGFMSTMSTETDRTTRSRTSHSWKGPRTSDFTGQGPATKPVRPDVRTWRWRTERAWQYLRASLHCARSAATMSARSGKGSACSARLDAETAQAMRGYANVVAVRPAGVAAVYDLTVDGVHEFYANGVIVSNCYEDTGRFFEARPHQPRQVNAEAEARRAELAKLDPLSRAHHEHLDKQLSGRTVVDLAVGMKSIGGIGR